MHSLRKRISQETLQPLVEEEIIKSKAPLSNLPNSQIVKELSTLANAVYYELDNRKIPRAWTYYGSYDYNKKDNSGFNAAIFYKYDFTTEETVGWAIAIRGTDNTINVADDVLVMFNKIPRMIQLATEYVNESINEIRLRASQDGIYDNFHRSFETAPLYIVGHSLGAVVASMIYTDLNISPDGRIQYVGFDNPGSLEIIKKYLSQKGKGKDLITVLAPWAHNIQSDVNIINTCNQQWGDVHRIIRWDLNYGNILPTPLVSQVYAANAHYIVSYTGDQHRIFGIMDALINNNPFSLDDRDIHGFQDGYREYLNPETRREYWTQYCKYCWDNDKEIRDAFKTLEKFTEKMFSDLKVMYGSTVPLKIEQSTKVISDCCVPTPFPDDHHCDGKKQCLPNEIPVSLQAEQSVSSESEKKGCCIPLPIGDGGCKALNLPVCSFMNRFSYWQTSGASRATPIPIFSWLDKVVSSFTDYSSSMVGYAMDNMVDLITSYSSEVVQDCPSYFPQDAPRYWQTQTPGLMFSNATTSIGSNAMQLTYTTIPALGR